MDIFDTHAHYDSEQFDEDREALLEGFFRERGGETSAEEDTRWRVLRIVNVGASFQGAVRSLELAEQYPGMYAACGVHPDEVGQLEEEPELLQALERMCADKKCVAVGEIGLDYHWMVQPRQLQQKWFIRQMELSARMKLPINVHSRDAAADTFELIRAHHASTGEGGIIHCYSGSAQMAKEYVKLGYHLGIGGVITFQNARVLKEVVEQIPLTWLVTETDSPYLAPTPFRGKRNDSRNIRYVIETIARIKEIPVEEAALRLYENACRVYRLV